MNSTDQAIQSIRPGWHPIAEAAARQLYADPCDAIWLSHGSFVDWCSGAIDAATIGKDREIQQLTRLLDEAMEVFKAYLNVPEATALREKWERLKNQ